MIKPRPIKAPPGTLVGAIETRLPVQYKRRNVASHFCYIVGRAYPKMEPIASLVKQRDE